MWTLSRYGALTTCISNINVHLSFKNIHGKVAAKLTRSEEKRLIIRPIWKNQNSIYASKYKIICLPAHIGTENIATSEVIFIVHRSILY